MSRKPGLFTKARSDPIHRVQFASSSSRPHECGHYKPRVNNPGKETFDVLIVGGGPAGIAAACCAAGDRRRVGIVDDGPTLGGQIWRGGQAKATTRQAATWLDRAAKTDVEVLTCTQVFAHPEPGVLMAETAGGACSLGYEKLILATGGRELFVPLPGWTLPNVVGAAGLQSLVKSGTSVAGKRVVVAGSGPLLLAVAAYLRQSGANVALVAEQAPLARLVGFGVKLLGHPRKLLQGAGYKWQLPGVPYRTGIWPVAAAGDDALSSVTLTNGRKTFDVPCDVLACGFGFLPSLELPMLVGCPLSGGVVQVDTWQETPIPGVYAAGESTGIAGVEKALVEGQIAGRAAVGKRDEASRLFAARERAAEFGRALGQAFALRDELKTLARAETIVCRCEDVTAQRLAGCHSWREAKLHTRCGMGPCQGRICSAATELLFGWQRGSVRPPIFPARLDSLRLGDALSSEVEK